MQINSDANFAALHLHRLFATLSGKEMNKEIELHDSTLSEIKQKEDKVILIFDKAIIHHSNGTPGIDDGTCWVQKIEIIFGNASLKIQPKKIPVDISDGCLTINNQEYRNMFKSSLKSTGNIFLNLLTGYNENLDIEAKHIEVREIDDPVYLQEFYRTK